MGSVRRFPPFPPFDVDLIDNPGWEVIYPHILSHNMHPWEPDPGGRTAEPSRTETEKACASAQAGEFGIAQHLPEIHLAAPVNAGPRRGRVPRIIKAHTDGPGAVGAIGDELTLNRKDAMTGQQPVQPGTGILTIMDGDREKRESHN